jgi:hypothetical protein
MVCAGAADRLRAKQTVLPNQAIAVKQEERQQDADSRASLSDAFVRLAAFQRTLATAVVMTWCTKDLQACCCVCRG